MINFIFVGHVSQKTSSRIPRTDSSIRTRCARFSSRYNSRRKRPIFRNNRAVTLHVLPVLRVARPSPRPASSSRTIGVSFDFQQNVTWISRPVKEPRKFVTMNRRRRCSLRKCQVTKHKLAFSATVTSVKVRIWWFFQISVTAAGHQRVYKNYFAKSNSILEVSF